MKAVKTIQIVMDVRDYRFIKDCATSCIELRRNPQVEIDKLNMNKVEHTQEQSDRLDYLHKVLKPTVKFLNDNFDGSQPKIFEYGELKYFMSCLSLIMHNKIAHWKSIIKELEKELKILDAEYDDIVYADYENLHNSSIFYANDQIRQVEALMIRIKEMFKDDEDDSTLEEMTLLNQFKNIEYETIDIKKISI